MLFLIMGIGFLAGGIYLATIGLQIVSYTFIPMGVFFLLFGFWLRKKGANAQRLMTAGLPGTAKILSVEQTNMEINNQPVIKLGLEISGTGVPVFQASQRSPIPLILLGQLKLIPGTTLPVKIDPVKHDNFIIDWQGAIAQQTAAAAGV